MEGNITSPLFSSLFSLFFFFLPPFLSLHISSFFVSEHQFCALRLFSFALSNICIPSLLSCLYFFSSTSSFSLPPPFTSYWWIQLFCHSISYHNLSSFTGFVILTRAERWVRRSFYGFQEESVNMEKLVSYMMLYFVICSRLWVSVLECVYYTSHYFTSFNTSQQIHVTHTNMIHYVR